MLVVHPAATRLEVVSMVHGDGVNSYRSEYVELKDELRMGLLYDLVQETVRESISRFIIG